MRQTATPLHMPVTGSTGFRILSPRLDLEENDDDIFEHPKVARRRDDLDNEDEGREERLAKRVRFQGPKEERLASGPSNSANRLHIKHSGGRRTQGATRRR